jgi:hypothetical protein
VAAFARDGTRGEVSTLLALCFLPHASFGLPFFLLRCPALPCRLVTSRPAQRSRPPPSGGKPGHFRSRRGSRRDGEYRSTAVAD